MLMGKSVGLKPYAILGRLLSYPVMSCTQIGYNNEIEDEFKNSVCTNI